MPGRYCLYFLLLSVTFSCGGAAIVPKDVRYDAEVGDDQQIPWVYDNAADMFTVIWTYATSASAAQTNIMSQSAGSAVNIIKSNVEHNGNGAITLKNVTQSDSGVYYCEVSYSLGSGHSPVTGTATLSVTVPPVTTTTTTPTTTTTTATTSTTTTTSTPTTTTTTTPTTTTTATPTTTTTILTSTTTTSPTTTTTSAATLTTTASTTTPAASATVSTSDSKSSDSTVVIISVTTSVGLVVIVMAIVFICILLHQRKRKQLPEQTDQTRWSVKGYTQIHPDLKKHHGYTSYSGHTRRNPVYVSNPHQMSTRPVHYRSHPRSDYRNRPYTVAYPTYTPGNQYRYVTRGSHYPGNIWQQHHIQQFNPSGNPGWSTRRSQPARKSASNTLYVDNNNTISADYSMNWSS